MGGVGAVVEGVSPVSGAVDGDAVGLGDGLHGAHVRLSLWAAREIVFAPGLKGGEHRLGGGLDEFDVLLQVDAPTLE